MSQRVAERVMEVLDSSPGIETVDLTGGAPELNSHFRYLVSRSRKLGRHVIDRCNLTVLYEDGQEELPEFLAEQEVEIIASLPCYRAEKVDRQRGRDTFERSIAALQRLNALGYGLRNSELSLHLVYNPQGAVLPPDQRALEAEYKKELRERFGIEFHRLLTITNMPIKRFRAQLSRQGALAHYLQLLIDSFNAETLDGLMCRSLVNVSFDGKLYDCDFNQMLGIGLSSEFNSIWDIGSFSELTEKRVAVAEHCFGCTAGSGSGCSGALGDALSGSL